MQDKVLARWRKKAENLVQERAPEDFDSDQSESKVDPRGSVVIKNKFTPELTPKPPSEQGNKIQAIVSKVSRKGTTLDQLYGPEETKIKSVLSKKMIAQIQKQKTKQILKKQVSLRQQ